MMNIWSILVRHLCAALLAAIFAVSLSAAGSTYGEDYIRFGHNGSGSGSAPALAQPAIPQSAEPSSAGDDYQRHIAALETHLGPYADGLVEPLGSLGHYYLARGESDRALTIFKRAMHVVRVNDGLYSLRQLPLLRASLDSHRVSGNHVELDERYDYFYTLFGRGQPPYTTIRLNAALAYLSWQREALRLELDKQQSRRLLALLRHNDHLLHAVSQDAALSHDWYAKLALSQLKNYYLVEHLVETGTERLLPPRPLPFGEAERAQRDPAHTELARRRNGSMKLGAAVIERALARIDVDASADLRARLLLAQGDWYQWHHQRSLAERYYSQTVSALSAAGRSDLLLRWFSEPVELPDNGVFFQPTFGEAIPQERAITLRYAVSALGRPKNIRVYRPVEPEYADDATRLLRKLRKTRFRPKWTRGYAEPMADITRRYVWLN